MKKSNLLSITLGMAVVLSAGLSAQAAPQVRITVGAASVVITDGGPGDSDGALNGSVSYIGVVGGWNIIAAGVTKPQLGSASLPGLDLTLSVTSPGAGVVTGEFSETGFIAAGTVTPVVTGRMFGPGSTTYEVWNDSGNALFGYTILNATAGPVSPGASGVINASGSGPVGPATPYSFTQKVVVQHATASTTSLDAALHFSPCSGKIGDYVWLDSNKNGLQDDGNTGINGVTVELYQGAMLVASTVTANNAGLDGYYQFTGLCDGTYTVKVAGGVPTGLTPTTGSSGNSDGNAIGGNTATDSNDGTGTTVTLSAGNNDNQTVDFGYKCSGQIGDYVWVDSNRNGLQDDGNTGINGVTVELYQGAKLVASTTTADNAGLAGYYQFTGLCDGAYTVKVVAATVPAGLTKTTGSTGNSNGNDGVGSDSNEPNGTDVTLSDGQRDIQTVDFGYQAPCTGKIGDFVWNDLNGNGCQDANEPGIEGVVVKLSSGCAPGTVTFSKTTTTDANGKYIFEDLCAGTYTVSFVTPNGFVRTKANQACNVGGQPSDSTDSDCDCTAGDDCGICVTLPADNSVDLTIDCGYIGEEPCITLTKTAASPTTTPGAQMTYTYTLNNCGGTTFNNLAIIDDNGTPGDTSDDFTVADGISLAPGETKSYTATVILPTPLCAGTGSPSPSAGTLVVQVLANGDIKVTLRQSRTLNENVYGAPASAVGSGWAKGHTFGNLTGSDKAEFRFTDTKGNVVLDFYCDYVTSTTISPAFPSGYRSLGPNGGDGSMVKGTAAWVKSYTSTLADNLNNPLNYPGNVVSPTLWTVNSPSPEGNFPNWDYVDGFTVVIDKAAFGANGFGGVTIPDIHNSPAKTGNNQVSPTPCGGCIENIANAVQVLPGNVIGATLATDTAEVCVDTPVPPTPPCVLTPGALKIDKKTVQLPIKNNGTVDIFLSQINVTWNQAVNGNLVKVSLNGDFWTGSVASGTVLNSGFNADAGRRKIAKGQTKTLVLTFANNASKTVSDYSGSISFGSPASCQLAFPPAAPPTAFDCDGHIKELKMKWNGAQNIKVVAHYGSTAATTVLLTQDNVTPGTVVTVSDYTGSPNDVIWEIFNAGTNTKIGESQFHTSCSDSTMDGPEDCGSAQGNGKSNLTTVNGFPTINTWQFVGLTTIKGTTLLCP